MLNTISQAARKKNYFLIKKKEKDYSKDAQDVTV